MASDNGIRDLVNSLQIASPCPMKWGDMQRTEEEAIRFCGDCSKNVYDVSKMSAKDASLLLQKAEISGSSTCMQLWRRADGTVITDDCPVGLRRIRDSWKKVRSAVATFALLLMAQTSFAQTKGDSADKGLPTRGKVAVPPPVATGGFVVPSVPLGGAPVPTNWTDTAMKIDSVKKISDKIAAKTKDRPTSECKLEILKLHYQMAEEADKKGVPYFALQELGNTQAALQSMQSDSKAKDLLKQVLDAKMSTSKKLGVKDTQCIQDEIDKLK